MKKPPMMYFLHRWRREMKATYQEMLDTPLDVVRADLEYISIERQLRASKNRNANPRTK